MRTPLTEDELTTALASLPAWSGDLRRISRPVVLTPEIAARIAQVADELDHHPVREGGRLVLWTHVRDAVTQLDIALARRIDELL